MPKKIRIVQLIVWNLYIFTIGYLMVDDTYLFFLPQSPVEFYYFFLKAFDPVFYIKWLAHLLQIIVGWLHWFVLIFFVYRYRIGNIWFWRIALPVRLMLDIFGKSYDMNIFESLYRTDLPIFFMVLGASVVIYIPSYIACYLYAYGDTSKRTL